MIPGSGRFPEEGSDSPLQWTSLVAQLVKNLPAMQETWVRFLSQEDPLEKEMETHSSIPAWRIPWTEEPDRLQSMGLQRVGHDLVTKPPPPALQADSLRTALGTHAFIFIELS